MAEVALLRVEDVHLDGPIPYIDITEHPEHARSLKTGNSSARLKPQDWQLLGSARYHCRASHFGLYGRLRQTLEPVLGSSLSTARVSGTIWLRRMSTLGFGA